MAPKKTKKIEIKYRAFGTEDFVYVLDHSERIKHLDFSITVRGTEREPALPPRQCLDPTTPLGRTEGDFLADWKYENLLTSRDIIIEIPPRYLGSNVVQRLPRLTWAALATIVLFGLILFAGGAASGKTATISQYVLIAMALAVFYPMLLYLSKHMRVHHAFLISFVAVSLLVLDSLRRWQGLKFAVAYGGFGLVILLGLFSVAALAEKGAGALVTAGVLVLVGFAMYAAPKVSLARTPPPPPEGAPPSGEPPAEAEVTLAGAEDDTEGAALADDASEEWRAEPVTDQRPQEPEPPPQEPGRFCAFCGAGVEEEFVFCSQCGKGARIALECAQCGIQVCRNCGGDYQFCPGCGAPLPHQAGAETDQTE